MHDPTRHELIQLSDAELDAVTAGQAATLAGGTTNIQVNPQITTNLTVMALATASQTEALASLTYNHMHVISDKILGAAGLV
jgi:hypothetical protein